MISAISLVAAIGAAVLAVFVVLREPKSVANRLFAAAMAFSAVEAGLVALSVRAILPGDALRWQQWRLIIAALASPVWLAFCLTYSRVRYAEFLRRWWWILGGLFLAPMFAGALRPEDLLLGVLRPPDSAYLHFALGNSGFVVQVCILLGAVLALANLERTFRASVGTMRWRIKLVVLGVGTVLGVRVYACSQALLQRATQVSYESFNSAALIAGSLLIAFSLYRTGRFNLDLYPSTTLLHRSMAVLLVGGYLVFVGVLAKVLEWFGGDSAGPLEHLVILAALLLLALLYFSDRVRLFLREFVSRHLRRPHFDYRRSWNDYTAKLAGQATPGGVCRVAVNWLAATFELLSATMWVADDQRAQLEFGASTSISSDTALLLDRRQLNLYPAIEAMKRQPVPVDLEREDVAWVKTLRDIHPTFFPEKGGSRMAVPLVAAGELVGVMSLGDRVGGRGWSPEDIELLECVAQQTASVLLNLKLAARVADTRETEAFQTMATFFAHDLKNTSNTLSLMLENLPRHFGDPAYRADALKAIERSVGRINQLGGQLGLLRRKLEVKPVAIDLSALVRRVASELQRAHQFALDLTQDALPPVPVDAEQFETVITNLLINAHEALRADGRIRVTTGVRDGKATFTVADNGCGMSAEFIRKSLFRPFQTTKNKGIGIGMYHVRTIVEAHRGWIEVESAPGQGTTFTVLLPLSEERPCPDTAPGSLPTPSPTPGEAAPGDR